MVNPHYFFGKKRQSKFGRDCLARYFTMGAPRTLGKHHIWRVLRPNIFFSMVVGCFLEFNAGYFAKVPQKPSKNMIS